MNTQEEIILVTESKQFDTNCVGMSISNTGEAPVLYGEPGAEKCTIPAGHSMEIGPLRYPLQGTRSIYLESGGSAQVVLLREVGNPDSNEPETARVTVRTSQEVIIP